jgi:hypothetical protein
VAGESEFFAVFVKAVIPLRKQFKPVGYLEKRIR